jgi:hypothetical protein
MIQVSLMPERHQDYIRDVLLGIYPDAIGEFSFKVTDYTYVASAELAPEK